MRWDGVVLLDSVVCLSVCAKDCSSSVGVVLLDSVVCPSVCAKDCSSAVGWSSAVRQRRLSVGLCEGL